MVVFRIYMILHSETNSLGVPNLVAVTVAPIKRKRTQKEGIKLPLCSSKSN